MEITERTIVFSRQMYKHFFSNNRRVYQCDQHKVDETEPLLGNTFRPGKDVAQVQAVTTRTSSS